MELSNIIKSSLVLSLLMSNMASGGVIRTILMDNSKMEKLFLKLGQSTVLRFREKPKKVVIGNQNYFNVEFVDNDITIQPQENITSNLFVYGEYHTYGLIMQVGDYSRYDDLVNIRWKSRMVNISLKTPKNQTQKRFRCVKNKVFNDDDRGLVVVDLVISNNSGSSIITDQISITVISDEKNVETTVVFEKDTVENGKEVGVRIIFKKVKARIEVVIGQQKEIITL